MMCTSYSACFRRCSDSTSLIFHRRISVLYVLCSLFESVVCWGLRGHALATRAPLRPTRTPNLSPGGMRLAAARFIHPMCTRTPPLQCPTPNHLRSPAPPTLSSDPTPTPTPPRARGWKRPSSSTRCARARYLRCRCLSRATASLPWSRCHFRDQVDEQECKAACQQEEGGGGGRGGRGSLAAAPLAGWARRL